MCVSVKLRRSYQSIRSIPQIGQDQMETSLALSSSGPNFPFFEQDFGPAPAASAAPSEPEDFRFPLVRVLAEQALVQLSGTAVGEPSPLMELSPCIEKFAIVAAGLNLPCDVLEAAIRFPRLVFAGLVDALPRLIEAGLAEIPDADQDGEAISSGLEVRPDDWVCRLFGTALALMFLKAEACRDLADFEYLADVFFFDLGVILESEGAYTAAFDEFVATRSCGQRWIIDGVEESALRGPKRISVTLDYLGLEYQVVALTGERRHRLLRRYWQEGDLAAIQNDALCWAVRDWTDSRKLAFSGPAAIDALPRAIAKDQLFAALMWISDFLPSTDLPVPVTPREAECQSDIPFAMRVVGFTAQGPLPEESRFVDKRLVVARDWFWRHAKHWRRAPEVYAYIRKSLDNAWVRWRRTATFEGDSEAGLGRKDGWRPIETTFADCDLENAPEIDVETHHQRSHTEIEVARTRPAIRRQTGSLAEGDDGETLQRPSRGRARSLSGVGFAALIMIETDIERAFEAIYGRQISASKGIGLGIPAASLKDERPALGPTSKRDLEVFVMRYLEGFDRQSLSVFAGRPLNGCGPARLAALEGITPRAAAAGWRNVAPERRGGRIIRWLLAHGYSRADLAKFLPDLIGALGAVPLEATGTIE
jgi:hypothetical protein